MSTRPLSCLFCGLESFDVRMALVITPTVGRRQVDNVLTSESRLGKTEPHVVSAPEVFANEPRCRDRRACEARVAAIEAEAKVGTL